MNLDWNILNWIQSTFNCGFFDFIMPKISILGDAGIIWIISAIALICTKKYRKYGFLLAIGLIVGVLIGNVAIKNLVARPRPCWINEDFILLIPNPTDYSFPSGHTLSSVISATILTMTNRKFGYIALPVCFLIIFSRLYLYVHFPSDILGGIIIGGIIGFAVFTIGNRFINANPIKKSEQTNKL